MTKSHEPQEWKVVEAASWLAAYGYARNGDDARDLAASLAECRPIHRAMAGITDRDEWVDALSLIHHQTANWSGAIWTVRAADLATELATYN